MGKPYTVLVRLRRSQALHILDALKSLDDSCGEEKIHKDLKDIFSKLAEMKGRTK